MRVASKQSEAEAAQVRKCLPNAGESSRVSRVRPTSQNSSSSSRNFAPVHCIGHRRTTSIDADIDIFYICHDEETGEDPLSLRGAGR